MNQQALIDAAKSIGLTLKTHHFDSDLSILVRRDNGQEWNPLTDFNDLALLIGGLFMEHEWEDDRVMVIATDFKNKRYISSGAIYPNDKPRDETTPQERIQALAEACVLLAAQIERAKHE